MQYIDTGNRHADQALGSWVQKQLTQDVAELRWQSGFFSGDGLAPFAATLQRLSALNSTVHVLIGSNEGGTLEGDVAQLVSLLQLPRSNARLGVVSFGGSYYHPKTYHVRRTDGSEAAYVGSANLTLAGVGSLHVEAGVILDSRDGDPAAILNRIATCVDEWFTQSRVGMELVGTATDVPKLTALGVLSKAPIPRPPQPAGGGGSNVPPRPRLAPLLKFAPLPTSATALVLPTGSGALVAQPAPTTTPPATPAPTPVATVPAVPQSPPYPNYVLFAPGATSPTTGAAALSGATLPSGASGLIVRLSRDSSRHWQGGKGTANISIPTATVSTLRFGFSSSQAPRAELEMEMRYLSSSFDFRAGPTMTSVQVYGYGPAATGHGDVRLVVPRPPARALSVPIAQQGLPQPDAGNVGFLEWPTLQQPRFRLTLLDPNSAFHAQALSSFSSAATANQLVGAGACWLPTGLSPAW